MCISETATTATGKLDTLRATGQAREGDVTTETHTHLDDSDITVFPVNPAAAYYISGDVGGISINFVLDTGAAVCLLRKDVWDRANTKHCPLQPWNGSKLVSVDGSPVQFLGVAELSITVQEVKIQQEVIVVENLTAMGILGLYFLDCYHGSIDTGKQVLHLPNLQVEIPLKRHSRESPSQTLDVQITVALQQTVVIPPLSELEVMATLSESDLSEDQ